MTGGVRTRSEVLVLIEQRLTAVRLRASGWVGRVVALEFHVDGVLVGILVGFVNNGVRLRELARGGSIEQGIGGVGGDPVNYIGEKAIWKMLAILSPPGRRYPYHCRRADGHGPSPERA